MHKKRNKANPKAITVHPAALAMLPLAEQNNMETMWDRLTRQSYLRIQYTERSTYCKAQLSQR